MTDSDGANGLMRRRLLLFLVIVAIGLAVDLAAKSWAFRSLGPPPRAEGAPADAGKVWWLIPNHVGLQTSLNEGALFGMGQGGATIFATMAVVALLGILAWLFWGKAARDRALTIVMAAATAGVLGNLYDRLGLHGLKWAEPDRFGQPAHAVRDWILIQLSDTYRWPNFNVADSLLVCGVAVLFFLTWRHGGATANPSK